MVVDEERMREVAKKDIRMSVYIPIVGFFFVWITSIIDWRQGAAAIFLSTLFWTLAHKILICDWMGWEK